MSLDYPNRAVWLNKRCNPVAGTRIYGRMLKVVPASGKNRDPAMNKGVRGPLIRATGPGSYDEWKRQLAADRAAKRAKL